MYVCVISKIKGDIENNSNIAYSIVAMDNTRARVERKHSRSAPQPEQTHRREKRICGGIGSARRQTGLNGGRFGHVYRGSGG